MNDTLKAAGRIGAELGAAKAENEKLRGLLTTAWRLRPDQHYHEDHLQAEQKAWEVETAEVLNAADALSQQPEPTDTYTAVDMATAAAQAFRDGQAATVKDCLTVQPMAYAVFAANGNVVCFSTRRDHPSLVALEADGHSVVSLAPIAQTAPQHPDDAAVDRFAAAMKAKLAKSRAKGRGGWDDPNVCSVEFLAQLLVEHLGKGNAGTFEDVANFAMMLHQRGADPMVLAEAAEAPIKKARGEALELGVRALESKSEHTEPAPAQDERKTFEAWAKTQGDKWLIVGGLQWSAGTDDYASARTNAAWAAWQERAARAARPAQTEQQPIGYACQADLEWEDEPIRICRERFRDWQLPVYAAPIAQTAPQGKFRMGDLVRKTSGSEWQGRICGTYSTPLTPEGYAVESEAHAGSVQIYPAKALELVAMAAKEA